MVGLQFADIARRLAVARAVRSAGIESHVPIPHRLQADTADLRRPVARAALIDLGQRQQPPALSGVAASLGQSGLTGCIIVRAKLDPGPMANRLFATIESESRLF
jgi:hypothetical protein